jgi:hypothetical protein
VNEVGSFESGAGNGNDWRNKIQSYADVDPAELLASPFNHRVHSRKQAAAVDASLDRIGWITPVIVNATTSHVVDGHLRIMEAIDRDEETIPVAYVELTVEEERIAIASFDAIAGMATIDEAALAANVADIDLPEPLAALIETLIDPSSGIADAEGAGGDADTPNSLTFGYATFGKTKVECTVGEVDTLNGLWEAYRATNGTDEGFVAWLATHRAAEAVPA